jgi:hypothetical protein
LLVTEELRGRLGNYKFKWLVSCKHFAKSNKSVQEGDEPNILERIESYNADGFIGFYSTLPATGLNTRLNNLKEHGKIKDHRIFDHKLIESQLIRKGFSQILMRYFPEGYKLVKPLHIVMDKYIPLHCVICEKDLLEALYREEQTAIVALVRRYNKSNEGEPSAYIDDVYWACKGACDEKVENMYREQGPIGTPWRDISDLANPALFLDWIFYHMINLQNHELPYTDSAFHKLLRVIVALSQKNLREMTAKERERAREILSLFS